MTFECLWRGIEQVKPGNTLRDIGMAIQTHAEDNGFSVVRDFCGHGLGRVFHDEPNVVHYGEIKDRFAGRHKAPDTELKPGHVFHH